MGPNDIEMVLRLVLAFVLGAVPGFEREQRDRPAGLRTHMLVSGGSACFTMVGIYAFDGPHDWSRIAAQVVSGIGFLGAGSIIRDRGNVRGLTTAASIWIVSAIGMLAGGGLYLMAVATAVLTFIVLRFLVVLDQDKKKSSSDTVNDSSED